MPALPYIALWFLVLAAAVLSHILGKRYRLTLLIGPVVLGLAGVVWLLAAPDELASGSVAGWQWVVDSAAWQLTGLALLVAFASTLSIVVSGWPSVGQTQQSGTSPSVAPSLFLVAATLPMLWAGDGRTMVAGYTVLLGAWLLVVRTADSGENPPASGWQSAGLLVGSMLLLWLAVAWSGQLGGANRATAALIAAGLVAAGAFPGGGWRTAVLSQRPQTAALLLALPVLAGGKLLAPLTHSGGTSGAVLAVGTAVALVSLLMAIRHFFSNEISICGLALSVAAAMGGMVLLAALWSGLEGMLAQVRVAVVAPAVLLLLFARQVGEPDQSVEPRSRITPDSVGIGLVIAALAAVPLTAGFRGLGGVYQAWLTAGGWPLLVVATLLMALLVMVAVGRGRLVLTTASNGSGRAGWLVAAPALLLGAALVALPWSWMGELSPFVWVAILVPIVVGVAGAFVLGRQESWTDLLSTTLPALPTMWRESRAATQTAGVGRLFADALADALAILEGPYGLLWVLALLVLFVVLS